MSNDQQNSSSNEEISADIQAEIDAISNSGSTTVIIKESGPFGGSKDDDSK
tara:strand:+ start:3341 stop:3493 length:153 start_codon:yes stop_codon:yes gene_type:complete